MIATLNSEWIKFRTVRMNWVLSIIAVGLPFVITTLTAAFIGTDDMDGGDLLGLILGLSVLTSMLIGVMAVASITSEFGFGTIRPTFAATPNRSRVIGAKIALVVIVGAAVEAVVCVVSFAAGSAILEARGGSATWTDTSGDRVQVIGIVCFAAIVSLLGLGLGMLLRSTPASVSILILWPLLAEGLVGALLTVAGAEDVASYLPFQAGYRLWLPDSEALDGSLGRWSGGLVFLAVAAVITALGAVTTSKRDA